MPFMRRDIEYRNLETENLRYVLRSCSRDILLGYSPIETPKTAPKWTNWQAKSSFQPARASARVKTSRFEPFSRCQSGCRPIEYSGSSY
jgi:hypothetical protein